MGGVASAKRGQFPAFSLRAATSLAPLLSDRTYGGVLELVLRSIRPCLAAVVLAILSVLSPRLFSGRDFFWGANLFFIKRYLPTLLSILPRICLSPPLRPIRLPRSSGCLFEFSNHSKHRSAPPGVLAGTAAGLICLSLLGVLEFSFSWIWGRGFHFPLIPTARIAARGPKRAIRYSQRQLPFIPERLGTTPLEGGSIHPRPHRVCRRTGTC